MHTRFLKVLLSANIYHPHRKSLTIGYLSLSKLVFITILSVSYCSRASQHFIHHLAQGRKLLSENSATREYIFSMKIARSDWQNLAHNVNGFGDKTRKNKLKCVSFYLIYRTAFYGSLRRLCVITNIPRVPGHNSSKFLPEGPETWCSILMCNKSTSIGTSLEGTQMFAHVMLHCTFNPLRSKCPWWQDEEAAC